MRALAALLCLACAAFAAKVELVAGGGAKDADAPATECKLREPFGVEFAPDGAMIIVEMDHGNRVLRVDKAGRLSVIAGTGAKGFAGDGGPGAAAQFNGMHNLAITPAGDLLLADVWNSRVRKMDATGIVTTFAGNGKKGFSGDGGPAAAAEFSSPIQIALSPDGKQLYVTDIDNHRIRRMSLAGGGVETIAGNGRSGVPADEAEAKTAPLADPRAVAPATDGSFYILERGGHALRFVSGDGKIRTVAGTGKPGSQDGPALQASFNGPKHLCLDRDGTVLIADAENNLIRRYDPKSGTVSRVAGTGKKGTAGLGGEPLACELNRPHGVTVAPDGTLYITDSYNDRILRIVP